MKISVITICYNSANTLKYTLKSVLSQDYENIEHIIVDGGSTDNTLDVLKHYSLKRKIIISEKDKGIYDALNKGINKATGDFVTYLHSDDVFYNPQVISDVVKKIKKNKGYKIYLGDTVYSNKKNISSIIRYYTARNFKKNQISRGLIPPHPSSFIDTQISKKIGYNTKYKIAGDFDFFVKLFLKNKLEYFYINLPIIKMRWGGKSNKNIFSYLRSTVEIINSLNKNKIKKNYLTILLRIFFKYNQFKFDKITYSKLKRDFYFEGLNSVEKLKKVNFKLIKNYNKLVNKNNSFVYAGLNLAFIGFYLNNEINNYQNLYLWPDGLFSKIFHRNIYKIPGRNIVKNVILSNKIKSIHIIGNLTNKNRKFLLEKFNKKIKHTQLPYSNINKIIKFLKIKTNLNELTLITLPTPKQEIIAEYIKNNNKSYKIICIGASLNIASGEEVETPIIFQNLNLEFLWRLRTDTWRRIKRIFLTITYLVKDLITINKFNKINIKIIN